MEELKNKEECSAKTEYLLNNQSLFDLKKNEKHWLDVFFAVSFRNKKIRKITLQFVVVNPERTFKEKILGREKTVRKEFVIESESGIRYLLFVSKGTARGTCTNPSCIVFPVSEKEYEKFKEIERVSKGISLVSSYEVFVPAFHYEYVIKVPLTTIARLSEVF